MIERCDTCIYWKKSPTKLLGTMGQGPTFRHVELPGTWGDCEAIEHIAVGNDDDQLPTPDLFEEDGSEPAKAQGLLAFLSDGSQYFASITTRNDFGCALHESAP